MSINRMPRSRGAMKTAQVIRSKTGNWRLVDHTQFTLVNANRENNLADGSHWRVRWAHLLLQGTRDLTLPGETTEEDIENLLRSIAGIHYGNIELIVEVEIQ